ncbi:hypothetical protein ACRXCV_00285 (plasmid) [Halobacteriovorax sp. GFR7]
MKVTKRQIQEATVGQLEEMLAELMHVETSKAKNQRHMVEQQLAKLNAS